MRLSVTWAQTITIFSKCVCSLLFYLFFCFVFLSQNNKIWNCNFKSVYPIDCGLSINNIFFLYILKAIKENFKLNINLLTYVLFIQFCYTNNKIFLSHLILADNHTLFWARLDIVLKKTCNDVSIGDICSKTFFVQQDNKRTHIPQYWSHDHILYKTISFHNVHQ